MHTDGNLIQVKARPAVEFLLVIDENPAVFYRKGSQSLKTVLQRELFLHLYRHIHEVVPR